MFKTNAQQIPLPATQAEWLKLRQIGIGGSDVAALLGISKWRTPLDVYRSKVEEPEEFDNASMEWGRRLEPVIRQKYADTVGMAVQVPEFMFRHPDHPFMIADVDGIREDGRIVEIKTARTQQGWGEEETDEIPDYYKTQVQHYMTVLGATSCDVAVLIGASDFRIYTVEHDPELEALLIEAEKDFWENYVEPRIEPAPQSFEEMKQAYPLSVPTIADASEDCWQKARELSYIRAQLKDLESKEKELVAAVQAEMRNSEKLAYNGQIIATWKTSKPRVTFDKESFEKAMPDLYQKYLKEGKTSRTFLLKI